MRLQNALLVSLFVSLYGCQPEAPSSKPAAPAAPAPAAAPAPEAQATPPAATQPAATAPAKQGEAMSAEKAAPPAAAPAGAAPAAAEAKPEMKPAPAISEADAMQLAKKSNCLACHAVDKKVVGPAWKDVAAKYRGDAEAETKLVNKIAKGGSGVWGATVMPPSPQVNEADRKTLARFILSLK